MEFCEGKFYGIKRVEHGQEFDDSRMYFAFKKKKDALLFIMKWA